MANSRSFRSALVRRSQIIQISVEGLTNIVIAIKIEFSNRMSGHWLQRSINRSLIRRYCQSIAGVRGSISDNQIVQMMQKVLCGKPKVAINSNVEA